MLNSVDGDTAWSAVVARDSSQDGRFVFAVRTTGVYCRPGCPARRPSRRNVRFFRTPVEARDAGFRACKRCEPDSVSGTSADRAVLEALTFLQENRDEALPLEALATRAGLSPSHFLRQFKRRIGMTPKEYLTALRFAAFRRRVKEGRGVTMATYEAGFGSVRGVYSAARDALGMTPAQYARGGSGRRIEYAIARSPLGLVLVAVTDEGVCAVLLGDSKRELAVELKREFPKAVLSRTAVSSPWMREVLRYVNDTRIPLAVPLDYRGTPFQVRVWKALQRIPPGETTTYSGLAGAIGSPRSARAVASACARNTIALLVPCHRVVRKDGSPGGYKWGRGRKSRVLALEARPRRRESRAGQSRGDVRRAT